MASFKKWLLKKLRKGDIDIFEVDSNQTCYSDPDLPFDKLNALQSRFRELYKPDKHWLVVSGTGTGKIQLQYIASRYIQDAGMKTVILAPTKALVRSLYKDAVGIFGANLVGVNSRYEKNVNGKYYIVSTTEGFLSAVRSEKEWVSNIGLIIIDEAHVISDPERGGSIDAVIALYKDTGTKLLLMSATFPHAEGVARHLNAALLKSKIVVTKINKNPVAVVDDFEAKKAPKDISTTYGFTYNKMSLRLHRLKELLKKHKDESVLVFVPTKAIGFALKEELEIPFSCADISDADNDRIVSAFNTKVINTISATETLGSGVNTPADVVIIFGVRRGKHYLDRDTIAQMQGRAGRGKPTATVYLMGDRIELFNAGRQTIAKTIPIPLPEVLLTVLSLRNQTKQELVNIMEKSFGSTFFSKRKQFAAVDSYLKLLHACRILSEEKGGYKLTKEGILLARYYISPIAYVEYMKHARKIIALPNLKDTKKGCLLLSQLMPWILADDEDIKTYVKEFKMSLTDHESETSVVNSLSRKSGALWHFLVKPSIIPEYFKMQLADIGRWVSLMRDMDKFGVHHNGMPGRGCFELVVEALKKNAEKASNARNAKPKLKPQDMDMMQQNIFSNSENIEKVA